MLRKSGVLLAWLLSSLATQVYALGLGNTTVESALNQPLRVRIEIVDLDDTRLQDISVQLASSDDFQRFGIDRVAFLNNIRFRVESGVQGNYLLLTTNQVVREPYLSFILDTRWPSGRLLSEHTVLLDLPVFNDQQATPEVRQPISPVLEPPRDVTPAPAQPVPQPEPAAPVVEPPVQVPAPAPEEELEPEIIPEEPAPEPQALPDEFVSVDEEEAAAEEEVAVAEPAPEEPVIADDAAVDASLSPDPADAPEDTVLVTEADSLSSIALRVRPNNSVSLQQTMIAIQRLNPDGFIDDNINQLLNGAVLRVPSLADIQAISPQEAIDEVNRQNQLATVGAEPVVAASDTPPGQPAQQQGQLSVLTEDAIDASSASGAGNAEELAELDSRIVELENQLALRQEEADRARIEREELESRLSDLDEQIAAAQEIIRLQDLQLAQLQESLVAAAEEAAVAAAEAAAAAAIQAELDATQPAASGSLVEDILRILTGNIMFMALGLGLVVLLLVFLLMRRNKFSFALPGRGSVDADELEQEFDADELTESATGLQDDEGEELDSDLEDILGEEEEEDDDTAVSAGDPLSQASVHMAHNRLDDAAQVLRDAIEEDEDNSELRLKLLEVLSRQGDLAAFEEQADLLSQQNDPAIDTQIDRFRETLAATGATRVETPAAEATKVSAPKDEEDDGESSSFLDDLGIDLDSFGDEDDDTFSLSGGDDKKAPEAPKAAPKAEVAAEDDDADMDLTFDLGGDDEPEAAAESEEPAAEPEQEAAGSDTELSMDDFDFDVDEEPAKTEADEAPQAPEEPAETEDDDAVLSLDDDQGEAAELTGGDSKDPEDLEIDSLDFDATAAAEVSTAESEDEPEQEVESVAFDTSGLDLDKPAEEPEPAVAADDDNALDFDFDKSEIKAEEDEPAADEEIETFAFDTDAAPESAAGEAAADDAGDADLDFDLDAIDETAQADQDEEIDIDLDSAGDDSTEAKAEDDDDFFDLDGALDDADSKQEADATADVEDIEIELDDGDEESPAAAESEDEEEDMEDLGFLSEDDDVEIESVDEVEELETLSDADETATKLELAYAYQKMGDAEGAREILQEVIKEGSAEQVKEAEELLAKLKS